MLNNSNKISSGDTFYLQNIKKSRGNRLLLNHSSSVKILKKRSYAQQPLKVDHQNSVFYREIDSKLIFYQLFDLLTGLENDTFDLKNIIHDCVLKKKIDSKTIVNLQKNDKQLVQTAPNCSEYFFSVKVEQNNSKIIQMEDSFDSEIEFQKDYQFQSEISLNIQIIEALYDSPSPFIVIYSVSLLLKYLAISGKKLSKRNVGKLLLISIILAYKYSFDQPIQQINRHFSCISGLSLCEINHLELLFLFQMQFKSFIPGQLFFNVSDLLYN